MNDNAIDGYILTGGAASRMGRDKGSLTLGGQTFVERIAAALSGVVRRVYTVGGDREHAGLSHVADNREVTGIDNAQRTSFAGLYTALMHSDASKIVVTACDMPFVTGQLFDALTSWDSSNAAIAAVSDDGIVQPLCAVYDVESCRPAIQSALADRELGLRRFLGRVGAMTISFSEISGLAGSDRFFINVNTPEDLEAAQVLILDDPITR